MSKGDDTRRFILHQALDLSTQVGLEGLTVGTLAKRVGMSKSGLYAHIGSKEELQSQVLDAAVALFVEQVLTKVFQHPRGLPRVRELFQLWLNWTTDTLSGGCPFIAAAAEFDDRPGPVRDTLVRHQRDVIETIERATRISVAEGHFHADLDVEQFAFGFWAILLAYHHFARLMRRDDARDLAGRAFDKLVQDAATG